MVFRFNGQGLALGNGVGQIFILIDGASVGVRAVRIPRRILAFIRTNDTFSHSAADRNIQNTCLVPGNGYRENGGIILVCSCTECRPLLVQMNGEQCRKTEIGLITENDLDAVLVLFKRNREVYVTHLGNITSENRPFIAEFTRSSSKRSDRIFILDLRKHFFFDHAVLGNGNGLL